MSDRGRLFRALLRQDLSCFVRKCFLTLEPGTSYKHNWHIDHICWQLTRVARGELRRLIINVPPRSMKSITVSVAFSAWVLGRDPTRRILCVSYADELARKLSIDTRTVIDSPWYRELFARMRLNSKTPRTHELVTTEQGYRFATGMGGSILGRGADLIIIDDPIKADRALSSAERGRVNEAFDSTIFTRLNDKRAGAIVIIMQRLHEDDLVGHVLERGDWEVVSIPAIATEDCTYQLSDNPDHVHVRRIGDLLHEDREDHDVLDGVRRYLGSLVFSAQYQQAPVPPEGNIVRREWLRYYDEPPKTFDFTIASWDTASTLSDKADYSVGTVWGAKNLSFYLLDCVRGRFEVPDLRRQVIGLAARWNVEITVVEEGDVGRALVQDLRRSKDCWAVLQPVRFDKEARFLAQSARFEAGQVVVPARHPGWPNGWGSCWPFPMCAITIKSTRPARLCTI
jgi:predicted phage terminase large subunit-like protein